MDCALSFTTSGDAGWGPYWTSEAYYGGDCGLSGTITDDQETILQTTVQVTSQETVSFWWKVSSEEGCDWLEFYIDDELQDQISGEVGWEQKSYPVSGAGSHTLKWRYVKDSSGSEGQDRGLVDYLHRSGTPPQSVLPPAEWDQVSYTYDPMGRRIERKVDSWTQRYVYDGDMVIAEYDSENHLLRKYVHAGTDEPICMIEVADGNAVSYYHYDGLGSVIALSDSSGDTIQTYEYAIYGRVAAEDANHPNPYLFTGKRLDIETGLYYYKARYYNPHIGRFMQTDPIGYGDGINWYRYCGNNPGNWIDPSGLIRLAFYDGREDIFREGADDEYFDYSFDLQDAPALMSSTDYVIWIISNPTKWDAEANYKSLYGFLSDSEITDIYFHCHGSNEFDMITIDLCGTELQASYDRTPSPFTEKFFADLGTALNKNNGSTATIHLRSCYAGEGRPSPSSRFGMYYPMLELASSHSGHKVTGCNKEVSYLACPKFGYFGHYVDYPLELRGPIEPIGGLTGPDYDYCGGKLMVATPHWPFAWVGIYWEPGTHSVVSYGGILVEVPNPSPY